MLLPNSYMKVYFVFKQWRIRHVLNKFNSKAKCELQCCNFLDSYNLHIYSLNDLFITLLFIHLTRYIIHNIKHNMNNEIIHQPIVDLYSYSAPPQFIDNQLIYKGFYFSTLVEWNCIWIIVMTIYPIGGMLPFFSLKVPPPKAATVHLFIIRHGVSHLFCSGFNLCWTTNITVSREHKQGTTLSHLNPPGFLCWSQCNPALQKTPLPI